MEDRRDDTLCHGRVLRPSTTTSRWTSHSTHVAIGMTRLTSTFPRPSFTRPLFAKNRRKRRGTRRTIIISSARLTFFRRGPRVNIIYNRRAPPRCCPPLSRGRPPRSGSARWFSRLILVLFHSLLLLPRSARESPSSRLFDNHYRDKRAFSARGLEGLLLWWIARRLSLLSCAFGTRRSIGDPIIGR